MNRRTIKSFSRAYIFKMFIWIIIGITCFPFIHCTFSFGFELKAKRRRWQNSILFSNHSIEWYNHLAKWQHRTEITTIKYRIENCHLSEWVVTSIETQAHISATAISSIQIYIVWLLCMFMINVSNVNCALKSSYTYHCVY